MPALVAGIHVLLNGRAKDVDGRDKPGHDDVVGLAAVCVCGFAASFENMRPAYGVGHIPKTKSLHAGTKPSEIVAILDTAKEKKVYSPTCQLINNLLRPTSGQWAEPIVRDSRA